MSNPISYKDMFELDDSSVIKDAIRNIRSLRKSYADFLEKVTGQQLADVTKQMQGMVAEIRALATSSTQLNITTASGQKQLAEQLQLITALREENARLRKTKEAVRNTETSVADSVNGLTQKLKEQVLEYNRLSRAKDTVKMTALASDIRKTKEEISSLNSSLKQTTGAFTAAKGSYNELDQRTKLLVRDLKALEGGMNNTSKEAKEMKREIFANTEQLKKFDSEINHNFRNVGNYKDAFRGLNNGLSALGLGTITLAALFQGLNKIISDAAAYTRLEAAIRATSDTQEEFTDSMNFLRVTADTYGQDLDVLANAYKGLNAAAKGTSLEGQGTKRIFEGIVIAGSALQLTNEQVEGSLMAVQQMMSKGKVQAEELRGQLGERLPGAFGLFAKAAGVSTAELDKQLKLGKVYATDVLPKFAQILKDTYSKQAIENAEQLANQTNRLGNAWTYFTKAFDDQSSLGRAYGNFKGFLADSLSEITFFLRKPDVQNFIGLFTGETLSKAKRETEINFKTQQFSNLSKDERKKELEAENERLVAAINQRIEKPKNALNSTGNLLSWGGVRASFSGGKLNVGSTEEEREYMRREEVFENAKKQYLAYVKANQRISQDELVNAQKRKEELAEANGDGEKEEAKRLRKLKEIADKQNQLLQESAKYEIAVQELAYSKSAKTAKDEEKLEVERLRILSVSYELRLKLYKRGSKEYYDILTEQVNAEKQYSEKMLEIRLRSIDEVEKVQLNSLERRSRFASENYDAEIQYEQEKLLIITTAYEERLKLYKTDSEQYREIANEKVKAEVEAQNRIDKINEDRAKGRQMVRSAQAEQQSRAFANQQQRRIASGTLTQPQAERENRTIEINSLTLEIDRYQRTLDMKAEGDKEYDAIHAALIRAQTERERKKNEDIIANEQEAAERRQAILQAVYDFAAEAATQLFTIGRDQNEANIAQLEEAKDRELEIAGNNTQARKKIEENYQKEIVKLKRKQAVADKAQALFSIALNTAMAVTSVLSTGGGTRYADLGISAATLSAIVIATGALQAAAVLSKPLPKYAVGRGVTGVTETAVVNEAGPELIKQEGGKYRVAGKGKPTTTVVKGSEKVITAKESQRILSDVVYTDNVSKFLNTEASRESRRVLSDIMRVTEDGLLQTTERTREKNSEAESSKKRTEDETTAQTRKSKSEIITSLLKNVFKTTQTQDEAERKTVTDEKASSMLQHRRLNIDLVNEAISNKKHNAEESSIKQAFAAAIYRHSAKGSDNASEIRRLLLDENMLAKTFSKADFRNSYGVNETFFKNVDAESAGFRISLQKGAQIMNRYEQQKTVGAANNISEAVISKAFAEAVKRIPIRHQDIDENGFHIYTETVHGKTQGQRNRNQLGKNG